jgi:hypothetical protein
MLMVPSRAGFLDTVASHTTTASAGVNIAASSTIHTKGAWTQLVANSGPRSLGIMVWLDNSAVGNTATSILLDIGIGAAGSETVLIPDLAGGYALNPAVSNAAHFYYFPLFIPANSRISARSQALISSDLVTCRVNLFQRPSGFGWVGTRVTAYGVDAANSRGTTFSCGNGSYGTAGTLSASTANSIKHMQIGVQGAGRGTLTDLRQLYEVRIGASTGIAGPLIGNTDTGVESVGFMHANEQLSAMTFNLPAGVDLRVAGMQSGTAANMDAIIYGVD